MGSHFPTVGAGYAVSIRLLSLSLMLEHQLAKVSGDWVRDGGFIFDRESLRRIG